MQVLSLIGSCSAVSPARFPIGLSLTEAVHIASVNVVYGIGGEVV